MSAEAVPQTPLGEITKLFILTDSLAVRRDTGSRRKGKMRVRIGDCRTESAKKGKRWLGRD